MSPANFKLFCSVFLVLLIAVESEHETVLCEWLSAQYSSWGTSCAQSAASCEFSGITCTTISSVTYYEIELKNKNLDGPLPESLSSITTLTKLDLKDNQFTGGLPNSWSSLTALDELNLRSNLLTGPLPNSWSSMTSITTLRLHWNSLSSTLPTSWSALTALTSLKLEHNSLTGPLPESWSALTALEKLYLYDNALTGTLPASWSGLDSIVHLRLQDNQLTSSIPESWTALSDTANKIRLDGNTGLVGELPSTWTSNMYDISETSIDGVPLLPPPIAPPYDHYGEHYYTPTEEETSPPFFLPVDEPYVSEEEPVSTPDPDPPEQPPLEEQVLTEEEYSDGALQMPATEPVAEESLSSLISWQQEITPESVEEFSPRTETDMEPAIEPALAPSSETIEPPVLLLCSSAATKCLETDGYIYEEVPVGSPFAEDGSYPGLPGFGIKLVDTSVPTKPGEPYEVSSIRSSDRCGYFEEDTRLVSVICLDNTYYCDTKGTPFCSSSILCVDGEIIDEGLDIVEMREERFQTPEIHLIGSEVVEITQGELYQSCSPCYAAETGVQPAVCDPGAEAIDTIEGSLTERIEVCSTNTTTNYFHQVGLSGCALNTSQPGKYNLTYTARDSLGLAVSVDRQIVVLPSCPEGEIVCKEVLKCSSGGSCFIHTREAPNLGEIELDSLEEEIIVEKNNTLELIVMERIGELVNIAVGETYEKCPAGTSSSTSMNCEPGVVVHVQPNQQSEYRIFACPSAPCKHAGIEFCTASLFETQGLEACNFDTNAPAGTQYELQFMAVPTNTTLSALFTTRYLILISPCVDDEYLCDEVCSPVPCDQLQRIIADTAPVLSLRYPEGLTLGYGVVSGCSILPCTSVDSESCGAHAEDAEDGDLSSIIEVVETTECTDSTSGCRYCNPGYLTSGDCLPGYYSYQFSITDSGGNTITSDTLEVNIVEIGEIILTVANSTVGGSLESDYPDKEQDSIQSVRETLIGSVETGLVSSGKRLFLNEEDIGYEVVEGTLSFQACLISLEDVISTVTPLTAEAITTDNSTTPVPAIFSSNDLFQSQTGRKLLQSSDEETSTLEDLIAESVSVLEATDLTELNLILNGTRSALVTEEINYALGTILSVVGELNALYRDSALKISDLIESVRLSVPDVSKTEKEWMQKITDLFSDQQKYLYFVEDSVRNSLQSDVLLDSMAELVNATQSAAGEMLMMINSQYRELSHMRDYQEFLNQVTGLSDSNPCVENSPEKRYFFEVPVPETETDMITTSRRLLQTRGGGSSRTGTTGVVQETAFVAETDTGNVWGSYILTNPLVYAFGPQAKPMEMETLLRGATNHRNYIVGGTVIQTERQTRNHVCYGRFAHLDNYCYAIPLEKIDMSKVPYGRDPVFLMESSLYDEESVAKVPQYYNPDSEHISPSGVPYGFFQSEMPGKLGTHFVYLDIQFSRNTAGQMLQYLQEGRFLDSITNTVSVRFVTYNPDFPMVIMSVNEIKCHWEEEIKCTYKIDALPDVKWNGKTSATKKFIFFITISIFFTLGYWAILLRSMLISRRSERGVATAYGLLKEHLGDILVAIMLSISVLMTIVFVSYEVRDLGETLRFAVYDSSHFTGAHWLLHKRATMPGEENSATDRWSLPPDITDIVRLSGFLESMETYKNLASISSVFQTLALIALILWLLTIASRIPRVSVITFTLRRCIDPLIYFMIPLTIVLVSFALMGSTCFGYRIKSLSSFSKSMSTVLEFTFFGGGNLIVELTPEGALLHPLERVTAILYKISLTCLSIFIFINFVLAILTDSFLLEKSRENKKSLCTLSDLNPFKTDIMSRVLTTHQENKRAKSIQLTQVLPCCSNVSAMKPEETNKAEEQWKDFSIAAEQPDVEWATSNVLYQDDESDENEDQDALELASCPTIPIRRMKTMFAVHRDQSAEDLSAVASSFEETFFALIEAYREVREWSLLAIEDMDTCLEWCKAELTRRHQSHPVVK